MGPGSFGTGKEPTALVAVGQQVAASMGPGSFGTGKPSSELMSSLDLLLQWGPVLLEPGSRSESLASVALPDAPRFNGARFFWNREDPHHVLDLSGRGGGGSLQWGPVLLEPGSEIQTYTVHSLARASMGPGSFGTGKARKEGVT